MSGGIPLLAGAPTLQELRPGDQVYRHMGGAAMMLRVTDVAGTKITCGAWLFDRATGAAVDPELNWGPPPRKTGSYIVPAPYPEPS